MDRYDAVFTSFGLDAAFESAILKVYIGKLIMIACKDREIMDGERWVLVSLSTDEAKRLLKYLEEHIAK